MTFPIAESAKNYHFLVMIQEVTFETIDQVEKGMLTLSYVTRERSDPPIERFAHLHNWYELVIFERVKGRLVTELAQYQLSGPCAVRIPPMIVHDFQIEQGSCAWTLIQFDFQTNDVSTKDNILASHLDVDDLDRVTDLVRWLKTSAAQSHLQESQHILALISSVIARSQPVDSEARISDGPIHKLKPALERLHNRGQLSPSLAEAASLCALSPSYFSRLFRAYVGMNFSDYTVQTRLKRAAMALGSSQKPLKQISHENGFHQPSYFSAQFKKKYGVTPSDFRRHAKEVKNRIS